ncbi:winged helix-turn-helix domain-containing protein [Paenibacillus sp. FSL R7-0048]|uniref:Transcriptional regulator n=1 Tax=Paenibacillus odorifer TaxID=189426 RepID=A0ABX3GE28_9BACL|nr:winged helix-turn-helix domain-containing protein [Paenibacillus odorifer]OMC66813.1 transcriptional regulator [Paenibacillus odorifer]OMC79497.1 transcriptional regulator [Paenibacillus odorifer]OMD06677.1 transcriptional regulator [Paenibacillus odorifer]OMD59060.1 transcriptional regulator [Paenibacillus odorifer]OMD64054.1 transcriptional regulator [Paenibacillus odorifer]
MQLELNESEYKVTAEGITIELFPKEFTLFQFLYKNRGRTFSREQLLDKVWPLEYPVERTVDDHIYRLRKKLGKLQDLDIKTVRGFGYSLTMQEPSAAMANPTTYDLEMQKTMREVFKKYHLYGQGRSMLILARQQDVLGYAMDPFYSIYIHFVQGDLDWLLNTTEVGIEERFYSLLICYVLLGDPKKKLEFCELVLEKKILLPPQHREVEILNILDLYILAGQPEKALERLKLTYEVIKEPGYESFIPITATSEMLAHLWMGTEDHVIERMATDIEALLLEKPYLREIGSYKVARGLWFLRRQSWREAEQLLDEALQVLEMSGFVPMRIYALYRIVHYCNQFPPKPALYRKYVNLFEREKEERGFHRLEQSLDTVLTNLVTAP